MFIEIFSIVVFIVSITLALHMTGAIKCPDIIKAAKSKVTNEPDPVWVQFKDTDKDIKEFNAHEWDMIINIEEGDNILRLLKKRTVLGRYKDALIIGRNSGFDEDQPWEGTHYSYGIDKRKHLITAFDYVTMVASLPNSMRNEARKQARMNIPPSKKERI